MASNPKELLEIYKQYLVQMAYQEGRPFRLPKTDATLLKRTDYRLFRGLQKELNSEEIEKREINKFMETARRHLKGELYIGSILQYFDAILKEYKSSKEPQWSELLGQIKSGFTTIEEYAIMNNKRTIASMNIGNPSPLLKMWKSGKVCDALLVYIIDINTIRNKGWFKVYCGSLNQNLSKVKSIIQYNEEVKYELEKGLVRLNKSLKAFEKEK
jgi:hypothetical protein